MGALGREFRFVFVWLKVFTAVLCLGTSSSRLLAGFVQEMVPVVEMSFQRLGVRAGLFGSLGCSVSWLVVLVGSVGWFCWLIGWLVGSWFVIMGKCL